ncbi:MAG TPA: hypothetical protein VMV90_06130 [Rectinemataceae bacterium]|nr:hypothetical protein [Rectinemataceae bacterium]
MGYYGWRPYVSVAERRRQAEREMAKLAKKGRVARPVRIEGKAIAKTFWGKAWCQNLESYSDYSNRLPRGRTYVRNGSVCHLEILEGEVRAKVSGRKLYTVTVKIKPLSAAAWADIKARCSGEIASILDLLGGKLADGVMAVVTDRKTGLFPKPREISLDCSCPDWAGMCKHVAATLYGVGARLDENPELLFLLRGVNHEELVSAKVEEAVAAVVGGGSRRRLAEADLSEVFGMDVEAGEPEATKAKAIPARRPARTPSKAAKAAAKPAAAKPAAAKPAAKAAAAQTPSPARGKAVPKAAVAAAPALPAEITGRDVRELRERLGLNGRDFALLLGVSGGAVSSWERKATALNLQERTRLALAKAWRMAAKKGKSAKEKA